MELKIVSYYDLGKENPHLQELENQPLSPQSLRRILDYCQVYATKHDVTFLYPIGVQPMFFVFKVKGKPGRKKNN